MISSLPNVLHNLQIEQQIALLGCAACGTRLICRMCNAICSLQIERLCCAIYLQIPAIGILAGILTALKKASGCSQSLSFAVILRALSLIPQQESLTDSVATTHPDNLCDLLICNPSYSRMRSGLGYCDKLL